MRRLHIVPVIVMPAVTVTLRVQAQEHTHTVAKPESLNHPHFAWVGGTETVVQVHGVGPTDLRFVNPEDDPRKKS